MILVLSLLALLIVLPYVVGPLIVKKQFRHRCEPELVPVQRSEMPGDAADYIELAEAALREQGFECVGRARIDTVKGVAAWVSLHVHPEHRDLAQAGVVARLDGEDGSIGPVEERHVEFLTRWPGRELLTNNSSQAMSFDPVRGQSLARLVDTQDIAVLYHVHRARVRDDGAAASSMLPEKGKELEALAMMTRDWMRAQEARGNVVELDDEPGMYGLTWRGAFRATWRHLWPFKGAALRRARVQARKLLERVTREAPVRAAGDSTADTSETPAPSRTTQ